MKKQQIIYSIILLMFSTAELTAQQMALSSIEWSVAGVLPPPAGQSGSLGVAGPVAGVHNNGLLLAGGANFPEGMPWQGGKKKYYSEGFVFRKSATDSLLPALQFSLPHPLGYSANCSTPQGLVAAGGENEAGLSNEVLLLQWNEVSQAVVIKHLPALPFAVTNASLAFHQSKLYLAGGERRGDVSSELLLLDLADTASGWKVLAPLPKPVSYAVLVVQSVGRKDYLYLVGGRKRNAGGLSDLYASVFRFDLAKGDWSEVGSLPYPIAAGTGIAAGSQSILLFGGDTGEIFHKAESMIAAIAKETNEIKKQQLDKEKMAVQSAHPGFCRQVLQYDTKKNRWSPAGCIPYDAPVTTTAVGWNGDVFIPSGEIKAGVRTPKILKGELHASSQLKTEPRRH